ncbi:XRE family transcriptional regulator [Bifidobacterium lemurum]|uniref:XRE family transcriptional regulator n=2 Tax=Bifidobacterium lemurum TaxID=1603886 RepID=A0A261FTN3_9BIFI|nr:helix-turn-helix transcriptional regulator [Bifidobacterium lemurum]OZG62554.1 XRE family transcriptional regulator [Bifidobacterium lemurum]QOL33886.1 helix-turn-helix transcriptional regulator [Bifidobacterium lemurum]
MVNTPVKEWLTSQGISYRDLATRMNQSPSSISQKLNRKTKWQEDDLAWLADNLGLSADFVIGKADYPYRNQAEALA